MKTKQPRWKKVAPMLKGAICSYRKGIGSVAIHDYGSGDRRFHMDYLGVSELFETLKEAKAYGNGFVVSSK